MPVLIFIVILWVLVFVHELGHFAVAKLFSIRVDEFGMGFPPRAVRLFRRGETDYTLNWIPFGGFVKIYGEDSLAEGAGDLDYARSLGAKKWWQQVLVLVAGVTMNVLLAWIIFTGSFMVGAPTLASQTDHPELLRNAALTVVQVLEKSPAEAAGLKAGDRIVKVSGPRAILSGATPDGFTDFIRNTEPGDTVTVEVRRGGDTMDLSVSPTGGLVPGSRAIGVSIDVVGASPGLPVLRAAKEGFLTMGNTLVGTFRTFGQLVAGKVGFSQLSGPVGLTRVVGDAEKIGAAYVFILAAIISINLAVINILPFPALDGGRILFVLIERIIRRPIPRKVVEWANGIGFFLLILLMVAVTVKDVVKLL